MNLHDYTAKEAIQDLNLVDECKMYNVVYISEDGVRYDYNQKLQVELENDEYYISGSRISYIRKEEPDKIRSVYPHHEEYNTKEINNILNIYFDDIEGHFEANLKKRSLI